MRRLRIKTLVVRVGYWYEGFLQQPNGAAFLRTSLELLLEKPELTSPNQHKGGVLGTSQETLKTYHDQIHCENLLFDVQIKGRLWLLIKVMALEQLLSLSLLRSRLRG